MYEDPRKASGMLSLFAFAREMLPKRPRELQWLVTEVFKLLSGWRRSPVFKSLLWLAFVFEPPALPRAPGPVPLFCRICCGGRKDGMLCCSCWVTWSHVYGLRGSVPLPREACYGQNVIRWPESCPDLSSTFIFECRDSALLHQENSVGYAMVTGAIGTQGLAGGQLEVRPAREAVGRPAAAQLR